MDDDKTREDQPTDDAASALPDPTAGFARELARFFIVPAIIVGAVILCIFLVVITFGKSSTERDKPLLELLSIIEQGGGQKVMSMNMPRDRRFWQAVQELGIRLDKDEIRSTDRKRIVVKSIARVLEADRNVDGEEARSREQTLIGLLGKMKISEAAVSLSRSLDSNHARTRQEAILALAGLHELPEARTLSKKIADFRFDPSLEVQVMTYYTLGVLSEPGDHDAIAWVEEGLHSADREVRWNAAVALARLGSPAGETVLANLLDPDYLGDVIIRSPDGKELRMSDSQQLAALLGAVGGTRHLLGSKPGCSPKLLEQLATLSERRDSRFFGAIKEAKLALTELSDNDPVD
jgi:hypothetical protein